ncbi:unnamed protein product [Effrenium voratum]|uniref:Uncharacterized protein n=1 Tax=Effrenium voratum TaxID=2562239 RepID=A0AA36MR41_9DINO|nr:unnamed protein product [Effrenium voratum]
MEGKEVVPTWDGAPKGWRRYCKEVAWYVRGNKQSMRKYLATRLISKLTGTARLLAMSWSQAEFDTESAAVLIRANGRLDYLHLKNGVEMTIFKIGGLRVSGIGGDSVEVAEWRMHRTLRVGEGLVATVECLKKKMLLTRTEMAASQGGRRESATPGPSPVAVDEEDELNVMDSFIINVLTGEMNGEMVGTLVGNIMSVGEMTILLYGNLLESNMEKTLMILDYKNCRRPSFGGKPMGGKFMGKHMNYADSDWHWDLVMAKGKNKNKNANWTAYDMAYAFPHGKNKGKFKGSKGSQVNAYVADYYGLEMEVDGQTRGDLHAAGAQSAKVNAERKSFSVYVLPNPSNYQDNEENRSLLVPVLVGMDFAGDTGTGMVVDLVDGTCVFSLIDPLRHYTLQQNSKGHYMVDLVEYLTGGVTVSQGHANIILLQERHEGKKQMDVLEKDRAMELDGRDPRASDQQWPCYGTREPMRHRSNKWGMWMHCSQCALRLIYLPKKGAPSDSTEVKNHQDVKQALKQLEDFATMRGILPTEEMVRVAIEKHTTNQRYADVLAKCKNKPVAAKPMKKGYQTTPGRTSARPRLGALSGS